MSKGSSPRPFSIPQSEFGNRFDDIFKKKVNLDEVAESEKETAPESDEIININLPG